MSLICWVVAEGAAGEVSEGVLAKGGQEAWVAVLGKEQTYLFAGDAT